MGLFGKEPEKNPRDLAREWARKMRAEMRTLDRQVNQIQREEEKVKRQIKEAAKKGDKDVCKILAREMVHSHKAVAKLYTSKAQINSVIMGMNNQVATVRLAGSLQKSTEVMHSMQSLIKVPEIAATMQQLSKEMMKAGIIEEMIEDTMESMEPEEMEEEIQAEVDKVLWEVTAGELGRAPNAVTDSLPAAAVPAGREKVSSRAKAGATALQVDSDSEEDLDQLKARLEGLKS